MGIYRLGWELSCDTCGLVPGRFDSAVAAELWAKRHGWLCDAASTECPKCQEEKAKG